MATALVGAILKRTKYEPRPLLPRSIADWPVEWRDQYEERAAIMEYDAGMERAEAERLAMQEVRARHDRVVW